jgi:Double-GTPase 2
MKECPLDTCFVPDTTCALGHLSLKDCPKWTGLEKSDTAQTESDDEIVLPWSGSALGRTDIAFVAGRRAPTMIGVVGPENAGKTSLLAAWYLLIGRGAAISKRHAVAGSFTLTGWEAVARSMQWAPGTMPEFPAHTSTRGGRGQGLLHLAVREDGNRLRDYLFTDAPGLWFQKWAINEQAPDAKGARWIAENADAFVLTADCAALAGTDRGSARSALQLLARRLGANRRGRPVTLVWTKSDIPVADSMQAAVRDAVRAQIPDFEELKVSMQARPEDTAGLGTGLTDLLRHTLQIRRLTQVLLPSRAKTDDPLFLFGARS